MWIELEDTDIIKIVEAVGFGPIADKLVGRPNKYTGAFVHAAEDKVAGSSTEIMVEQAGIISRGVTGAYVMTWMWVTDDEARIPSNFEENGHIIYTTDLKVCASVYVRAENLVEAQQMVDSLAHTKLCVSGDDIGEGRLRSHYPEYQFAETMFIVGQFDGGIIIPRYDIANDIEDPSEAAEGDVIYMADLTVCAAVYVRAKNLVDAQQKVDALGHTGLCVWGKDIGEDQFTEFFPEIQFAESMAIHSQFEGNILKPYFDIATGTCFD